MPLSPYIPHVLYATAVTSFSLHLLMQKKSAAERFRQADARITILEELVTRLQAQDPTLSSVEIQRLRRMGHGEYVEAKMANAEVQEKNVGWKTVVLGRKER